MSEVAVIAEKCPCGSGMDHASDMEVIRHDVYELRSHVEQLISLIGPIQAELQPMLEGLASSPIGKMLGIGNG